MPPLFAAERIVIDQALRNDQRIVLVLDAGGTSFRFNAAQGGRMVLEAPYVLPSYGDDLERSLGQLRDGFAKVHAETGQKAVAVSFAFPGPADYRSGIIGDLPNLRGYRGGVPIGPMLEAQLGLPTFIHNDGALFAYGEALGGLLPFVNEQLAAAGTPRRFRNLLGFTLGTGFGGGIVVDGRLVDGDHSGAGQIWTMRHRDQPNLSSEEGVSIRAIRGAFATAAGVSLDDVPAPKGIADIAAGRAPGDARAAQDAFRRLGQVAGNAIAHALALIDGLVVVGGGISSAAPLFLPALLEEMNGTIETDGGPVDRLPCKVLDLDDPAGLAALVGNATRAVRVPGTTNTVAYTPQKVTGLGLTRLGTTAAIALGAYAVALDRLDRPLAPLR